MLETLKIVGVFGLVLVIFYGYPSALRWITRDVQRVPRPKIDTLNLTPEQERDLAHLHDLIGDKTNERHDEYERRQKQIDKLKEAAN